MPVDSVSAELFVLAVCGSAQGRSYIEGAGGAAPPWPNLSRQIK